MEAYQNNESIAARIAGETLPDFNYSVKQIDIIKKIILATRVPQRPQTHLEEIMCDADLDYLGREDFSAIAATLREEWLAYHIIDSEKEWADRQLVFLEQHHYFTETSINKRGHQKQEHLLELKKQL